MKVKCISTASNENPNTLHYKFLTIGEVYEVVSSTEYSYLIIGDNNIDSYFRKDSFITIQELREQQLNELGI